MRKVVVDKELKIFFEEELDRIMQNNFKEKSSLEWKLIDLQNEFNKLKVKVKKLTDENNKLKKLIEIYDKDINEMGITKCLSCGTLIFKDDNQNQETTDGYYCSSCRK